MALTSQLNELRKLVAALEAEEAAQKAKEKGNTYSNHGNGFQNITGTKTNSGAYSGDGNTHRTTSHYGGGPVINNSDNDFHGHGNGSFIGGNFDASRRNY